jgi:ankyrin repeat protein
MGKGNGVTMKRTIYLMLFLFTAAGCSNPQFRGKGHIDGDGSIFELIHAIQMDSLDQVKAILARGVDVNVRDRRWYRAPLHWAAGMREKFLPGGEPLNSGNEGHPRGYLICEYLIRQGADLNAKGAYGVTPLHEAAVMGRDGLVKLFVKNGADLHAVDQYDRTPLQMAIGRRGVSTTKVLLDLGARVSFAGPNGVTALHTAAEYGGREIIDLVIKAGANVNAKDNYGQTPLHYAVKHRDREAVGLLIQADADVNARDQWGNTPLHFAAPLSHGKTEIGNQLFRAGADVYAKNAFGRTPFGLPYVRKDRDDPWEVLDIENGKISFEMPETPIVNSQKFPIGDGGREGKYMTYGTKFSYRFFAVFVRVFPTETDRKNYVFHPSHSSGDEWISEAREDYTKPITHEGIGGQEVKGSFSMYGKPWSILGREFAFGRYLLSISVAGPEDEMDDPDFQKFFKSLRIWRKKK